MPSFPEESRPCITLWHPQLCEMCRKNQKQRTAAKNGKKRAKPGISGQRSCQLPNELLLSGKISAGGQRKRAGRPNSAARRTLLTSHQSLSALSTSTSMTSPFLKGRSRSASPLKSHSARTRRQLSESAMAALQKAARCRGATAATAPAHGLHDGPRTSHPNKSNKKGPRGIPDRGVVALDGDTTPL